MTRTARLFTAIFLHVLNEVRGIVVGEQLGRRMWTYKISAEEAERFWWLLNISFDSQADHVAPVVGDGDETVDGASIWQYDFEIFPELDLSAAADFGD